MSEAPSCQLYLVTPPKIVSGEFASLLMRAFDAAPVASLMLRLDNATDDDWKRAAEEIMPLAQDNNTAFIINRRADFAHAWDADGVHLNAKDMPILEARALLGPDKVIGASCRDSRHFAMSAGEDGADYVSFQPIPELIAWWAESMELPCVALGDITPDNAQELVEAGADFLCLADIWDDPAGKIKALKLF